MRLDRAARKTLKRRYHQVRARLRHSTLSRNRAARAAGLEQAWLIELARRHDTIGLVPRPAHRGSVEHYYHFLFDLLLPLVLLCNRTSGTTFVLNEVGPLSSILRELYPDRVRLLPRGTPLDGEVQVPLAGLDPYVVAVSKAALRELEHTVSDRLGIRRELQDPPRALLIERTPPSDFYLQHAENRGAGASRRSIRNHAEVLEVVRHHLSATHQVDNVKLEELDFRQQLRLFRSANVLIGQHGAGLGNVIWMPAGARVLEFGFDDRLHFQTLCGILGQRYTLHAYRQAHIQVEPQVLSDALERCGLPFAPRKMGRTA